MHWREPRASYRSTHLALCAIRMRRCTVPSRSGITPISPRRRSARRSAHARSKPTSRPHHARAQRPQPRRNAPSRAATPPVAPQRPQPRRRAPVRRRWQVSITQLIELSNCTHAEAEAHARAKRERQQEAHARVVRLSIEAIGRLRSRAKTAMQLAAAATWQDPTFTSELRAFHQDPKRSLSRAHTTSLAAAGHGHGGSSNGVASIGALWGLSGAPRAAAKAKRVVTKGGSGKGFGSKGGAHVHFDDMRINGVPAAGASHAHARNGNASPGVVEAARPHDASGRLPARVRWRWRVEGGAGGLLLGALAGSLVTLAVTGAL